MLDGLRLFAAAGAALVVTASAATAQQVDMNEVERAGGDMAALAAEMLATNPTVLAQRAAVDGLAARLRSAQSGYLPSVQANALSQRRQLTIHGGAGDQNFTIGQVDVEARLPLFDGFRTPNSVSQAQAELESGRAALEATVQQALLDLLSAAADAHRDRRIRAFAEDQARAVAERLRSTSRLLELREATMTDESQAQARLAVSETNVLAVEEAVAASAAAFAAVMGRAVTEVPALPDLPPIPPNLDESRQLAESSPVVRAARGNAAAAQKAVDVARGAFAPQVDLVGGYEFLTGGVANLFIGRLPNDRSAVYGGVEMRLPLFQQGREYAELARARALRSQRLHQIAASLRETVRDVDTAWARWMAATGTIAAARRAVLAQEQAAQGVRREAVGGGSRTLIDVLDADNELLAARAALERAVRNEYVARATLLAATGRLALTRPAGDRGALGTAPAAPIRGQASN